MSLINNLQIDALSRFLDATVLRHETVTQNIANLDVPQYKTKDVNFRNLLQAASAGMVPANAAPRVFEVQGLMERPDGNNVSLEREGLLLATTQLQFQAGVQLLRSEFSRLKLAISEGK